MDAAVLVARFFHGTVLFILAVLSFPAAAQLNSVSLSFRPESDRFIEAAKQYQDIWNADGARIVKTMESVTGLKFQEPVPVQIVIYEGVSWSGIGGKPMMLRASYGLDEKKGTLIHELGHRLIKQLTKRPSDIDEHRLLNLFLYDVWGKLYGKSFADDMVLVESHRRGLYDYLLAWRYALEMSEEKRAAVFQAIVGENR